VSEPEEPITHQEQPDRRAHGIQNHGDAHARHCHDSKDAGDHAQVRREFVEDPLQHDETDEEKPERERAYGVDARQGRCEHSRRKVRGRDIRLPLDFIDGGRVVPAEHEDRAVTRPVDRRLQHDEQPHACDSDQHHVAVYPLQGEVERECNRHVEKVRQDRESDDGPPDARPSGEILEPRQTPGRRSARAGVQQDDGDIRDADREGGDAAQTTQSFVIRIQRIESHRRCVHRHSSSSSEPL
jgi:hypothetical protein